LIVLSCIASLFITPSIIFAESKNDLLNKGIKSLEKEKYKEAVKYFDKVLKIDSKNIDALNGKGVALLFLIKPKEATTYFDKALKIDPKSTDALNGKGIADGGAAGVRAL